MRWGGQVYKLKLVPVLRRYYSAFMDSYRLSSGVTKSLSKVHVDPKVSPRNHTAHNHEERLGGIAEGAEREIDDDLASE